MFDNIKRLNEEIAEQRQIIQKINTKCDNEVRTRTPEEKKQWQGAKAKIEELSEELRDFEEVEKERIERAKNNGFSSPTATGNVDDFNIIYTRQKDDKKPEKRTLGKLLRLAATKDPKNQNEEMMFRDLSTTTDSEGGYIVPSYTANEIYGALMNYSSVMQAGATVVDLSNIAADTFSWAKVNTLPTFGYYGQNAQISESDPVFGEVKFTPKKGAVLFEVPNELLQDGLNTDQKLEEICLAAAGEEIDKISLVGTGASNQPTGIVNQSGINTVDFGSGAGAAPTDFSELIDAKYEIMNAKGSVENLSAIHHPRTLRDYAKLVTGNSEGQPLQKPDFISDVQEFASQALSITETVGSGTALSESVMGDFRNLLIGMRLQPTVFTDPYRKSDYDQVVFRVTFRLDVQITNAEHFSLMRYIASA